MNGTQRFVKNVLCTDRLARDVCTYNIAVRFGMVQENREPIKFYFEKVGGADAEH